MPPARRSAACWPLVGNLRQSSQHTWAKSLSKEKCPLLMMEVLLVRDLAGQRPYIAPIFTSNTTGPPAHQLAELFVQRVTKDHTFSGFFCAPFPKDHVVIIWATSNKGECSSFQIIIGRNSLCENCYSTRCNYFQSVPTLNKNPTHTLVS